MIERYVKLDMLHVDVILQDGLVMFHHVGEYFRPQMDFRQYKYYGSGQVSGVIAQKAFNFCLDIIRLSNVENGVFHIEIFKDLSSFILNEIAIRPAGGALAHMYKITRGVNLFAEGLRIELKVPCNIEAKSISSKKRIALIGMFKPTRFIKNVTVKNIPQLKK